MCPIVACMIAGGDLMELVRGAFGRTPPLTARLRSWYHMVRLRQAEKEIRDPRRSGGVYGLVAPWDPTNPVRETTDRIWVATQRDSWRLERDWQLDSGSSGTSIHVCDGNTKWLPTAFGAFHASPADSDTFPARDLLDPSWLAGYDWGTPRPDIHNDRDVLVIHALLATNSSPEPGERDNPSTINRLRQRPPAETEVLVDAEYGFLHRMTGFINGERFVVTELLDLVVDPPLDEEVFRIDPSRFQVIDPPEMELSVDPVLGSIPVSPEPPPPVWSDLGAVAQSLHDDLDARVARLPVRRLRRWSDLSEIRAVEDDHVDRLARRYGLSGPDHLALQALSVRPDRRRTGGSNRPAPLRPHDSRAAHEPSPDQTPSRPPALVEHLGPWR